MSQKKSSFLGVILFYLFYPVIVLISLLPFRLLYLLSDLVYFIMYYIIKYRRKVIVGNIKIAFPDYSDAQVIEIAKKSTRHLSDMIFEMIKTITISKSELQKRFLITNIDYVKSLSQYQRPIFSSTGHYANFDWSIAINYIWDMKINVVFKPVKQPQINNLLIKSRSKINSDMIPAREVKDFVLNKMSRTSTSVLYMIIDQSPKLKRPHHFTSFFNQPTSVFIGYEELAREMNAVAVYFKIQKVKRGYYKATVLGMNMHSEKTKPWELTDQFYRLLEEQIREQPEFYMWSHKRWKVNLDNAPKVLGLSPLAQQLIDQQDHQPSADL
jgi:KDO2-lipid IV(A) lauroyltransferase